jgi:hypothetical protein
LTRFATIDVMSNIWGSYFLSPLFVGGGGGGVGWRGGGGGGRSPRSSRGGEYGFCAGDLLFLSDIYRLQVVPNKSCKKHNAY